MLMIVSTDLVTLNHLLLAGSAFTCYLKGLYYLLPERFVPSSLDKELQMLRIIDEESEDLEQGPDLHCI